MRNLEREIGTLIRKAICDMELDGKEKVRVREKNLSQYMGPRKYIDQIELASHEAGIATGLAYTSYGGTLLNIEVNVLDGTGKIELTGHLGDVMKESASAAVCSDSKSHLFLILSPIGITSVQPMRGAEKIDADSKISINCWVLSTIALFGLFRKRVL